MHFAHSTKNPDRSDWQSLVDHLKEVAELASTRGNKFRAGPAAALAGWLHDLGKYAEAFQLYIQDRGPSVDHSTAGARIALDLAKSGAPPDRLMTDLIAYIVAGHHAGLPDRRPGPASLEIRVTNKTIEPLDPIWTNEVALAASGLFPANFHWHPDKARHAFQLAMLGRMIFSCLIDADRIDTERFYAKIEGRVVDREWPRLREIVGRLIAAFDAHMAGMKIDDTPVNRLRADILAHVRAKAASPRGVFTLNVPTGGGKTLASLAFALDHAQRHGLDRIIYAIPFTSIIDQTADIFRKVLGKDHVLEHHSAIDEEKFSKDGPREGKSKLQLAMEDWAAPIVVTTNVQLLESLFADRPSRCRKLHNLANAVIVLDEAQTIPLPVLRPSVAALDELARNYGCTIVLCTATQPALAHPDFAGGFQLGPESELVPDPKGLHGTLRRFRLQFAGEMSDDNLVAAFCGHDQALMIVNSRAHALALYSAVKAAGLDGAVHLTTRQTAADRRTILAEVRQRLKDGAPCRLIATSLVEAGVDLDFPRVWRAEAGLDQIAQAGGRCNREGRRPVEDSIVTVFRPAEAKPPREIAGFIADMERMKNNHGDDPLSPEAMRDYFGEVYWRKGDQGLDRIRAKDLDGVNITKMVMEEFSLGSGATNFAYRTVGEGFRLIESGLAPVIVAIDDAPKKTLDGLRGGWLTPGAAARQLQPYTVQVPPKARQKLIDSGNWHVQFVEGFGDQFAVLKTDSLYTREIGLLWEDADYLGSESTMV
jgi:CRISPR-associated endonuclease/helicase Cas3